MTTSRFSYSQDTLRSIAADVLRHGRELGASGTEAEISESYGQVITVRKGEVETIEYNRSKDIGVSVFFGKRSGYASTSDFSPRAIADTVRAAASIARFTASDDANGLAEPELLARTIGELDLFHPWDLKVEDAIEIARACESAAFELDPRIANSEGASVSCQQHQAVAANSNDFIGGMRTSRHYVSCAIIAAENGEMQRDDWHATQRRARDLPSPEAIGRYAGHRALARLRARKLPTMRVPVLFEAPIANGLIGHFVAAVSGGNLYRKSTFLLDSLGKQVFAPLVQLREEPHTMRALASTYFDDDCVATAARDVVKDGIVQGYFLGVYSARKLGLKTTGNAGGNHNLILQSGNESLEQLIRRMGRGLLVTELMGQGVNLITGDYSRGASGYWVEGGEIRYPVEEITIAGNLREMFMNIVAIGNDSLTRGSRTSGSILIDGMTIAGN